MKLICPCGKEVQGLYPREFEGTSFCSQECLDAWLDAKEYADDLGGDE